MRRLLSSLLLLLLLASPALALDIRYPAGSSGGVSSVADPTASIGLSAVNGSATTAMRSDGAPALSQSIAPTWTGVHTFAPTARTSGSAPYFLLNTPADTTLAANVEAPGRYIGGNGAGATVTRQWTGSGAGTIALQRENILVAPTYAATSATTMTLAATTSITGPPIKGANMSGSATALNIEAGACSTWTTCYGAVINAPTGATSNYAMLINSGQLIVPDGTAAAPSIAFGAQPNIGLYRSSSNILRVAASDATTIFEIGYNNIIIRRDDIPLRFGTAADVWLRRNAAANLALGDVAAASPVAQTLSVQNGTGTNINAASAFTLIAPRGTGTGTIGYLDTQAGAMGTASGTTAHTAVSRHTFGTNKVLTNNSAIALVNATLASGSVHASQYHYAVEVQDGTDYQIEEGIISCHVTNKGGTIANNTCIKANNQQAMTAGTLTVTFAISAANPAVISVNANSSLTPSTGFPRVVYESMNLTQQAAAVQ